jgi:hypothetical protein
MTEPRLKPKMPEVDNLPKAGTKLLAEEIVRSDKDSRLIYCRFGRQYVINLEKQMNSLLNNKESTTLSNTIKSATYLINIKKLIKEHNIETEHNGF